MNFEKQFPLLHNFIGAYFPDSDLDNMSDENVVNRYISDASSRELNETKNELSKIIKNLSPFWQEVGKESNRYFATEKDAYKWLKKIQKILSKK